MGLEEAEAIKDEIFLLSRYFGDSPAVIDDHSVLFSQFLVFPIELHLFVLLVERDGLQQDLRQKLFLYGLVVSNLLEILLFVFWDD